jgi:hypothetical protein
VQTLKGMLVGDNEEFFAFHFFGSNSPKFLGLDMLEAGTWLT